MSDDGCDGADSTANPTIAPVCAVKMNRATVAGSEPVPAAGEPIRRKLHGAAASPDITRAGLALANAAPRCGAKRKCNGLPCKRAAEKPSGRCFLHGNRAGAPRGEKHGHYKHGRHSIETMERKRENRKLLRQLKSLFKDVSADD